MKKIFIGLLFMMLFPFNKAKADSLIHFNAGKREEISTEKLPEVMDAFDKIIAGTDDLYQLIVTPEHIREMKEKRQGIEILFSTAESIQIRRETKKADRLLLLFCSEPVCENKIAVFYLGKDGEYLTPPFISSKGGVYVDRIKKLIGK